MGLKYGHNEVCYPATLVLGDLIAEIKRGHYNIEDLAVAITQTGGQCRATNYLSFIKTGLKNAGFGQIPVISVAIGGIHQNEQPGFKLPIFKILHLVINAFLFGDSLNQIFAAAVARQRNKGQAELIFDKYMQRASELIEKREHKKLPTLLADAVDDFEIFVKYNNYGQANITRWLREQGYEVVVPPMIHFFTQSFINSRVNAKNGLNRMNRIQKVLLPFFQRIFDKKMAKYQAILEKSKFHTPHKSVFEIAEYAKEIIDLSNQFCEGWLIACDIANFSREGLNRVVCVQPFGCIANHIVAKGIERRIKEFYPDMNLLFLDIDGGMAEVNLQNRLKFLIN